jgi:hypothetical protein
MIDHELNDLFEKIKERIDDLGDTPSRKERLIAHLRSLSRWENEPIDYPDVVCEFPQSIDISFAVCHPECGVKQLIVDGSTQECQNCGGLMFRVQTKKYVLNNNFGQ